jgi:hypothetical protein
VPAYARPASQWLGRKLAEVKQTAAANTAGSTEYVIELPVRKPGDTRPEHKRAISTAITGDIRFDHQGNETKLVAEGGRAVFGQAVLDPETKEWVQVK